MSLLASSEWQRNMKENILQNKEYYVVLRTRFQNFTAKYLYPPFQDFAQSSDEFTQSMYISRKPTVGQTLCKASVGERSMPKSDQVRCRRLLRNQETQERPLLHRGIRGRRGNRTGKRRHSHRSVDDFSKCLMAQCIYF